MRRNKGILITMIVLIVILVIALVGLLLYKFVFSKDNTKNPQTVVTNPPVEIEPETDPIKVGDYVDYTPDASANYMLSGEETGAANNPSMGVAQEELNWRILSINDDGTVDIISDEPISTEVYFAGALGYNNGVFLLNDLCETLYSNAELGAVARSINIEDIENQMSDAGVMARDGYIYNNVAYGDIETYTEENMYVPELYSKEDAGESSAYYVTPTTGAFIPLTTIEAEQTFYKLEDIEMDYFEDEDFYDVIFGTTNGYWLASRCTDCSSETSVMFGLRVVDNFSISGNAICSSKGKSGSSKTYIRPVVTLGEDVIISDEGGTIAEPRTLTTLGGTSSNDDDEDMSGNGNMQDQMDRVKVAEFNESFAMFAGSNRLGLQVDMLVEDIQTSNETNNEHEIEIWYNGAKVQTIQTEEQENYKVEFEYDTDGYINKVIVEDEQ